MILFNNTIKTQRFNKEYHFFNVLLFIGIAVLFLCLKTELILFTCPYSDIGLQCKTCGLTTAFKNYSNNIWTNIHQGHFLLFILFFSQLLIRPLVSALLLWSGRNQIIRNMDIILSILLCGITFRSYLL